MSTRQRQLSDDVEPTLSINDQMQEIRRLRELVRQAQLIAEGAQRNLRRTKTLN